jgi:hypothetical protein
MKMKWVLYPLSSWFIKKRDLKEGYISLRLFIVEPPPAGAGGSLQERDLPRIPHSSPGGSRGIPIRRD